MTKETVFRYIWSSLVTFLAGFCIAIYPDIDSIELSNLSDGTFTGLVFVGVRAGVKALIELFITSLK